MLIFRILLVILILTGACGQVGESEIPEHVQELENLTIIPAYTEPGFRLRLNREVNFGDSKDVLIGTLAGPNQLIVDDSGRVYAGDSGLNAIHVFRPDGSYVTQLGREGRGPGEFRSLNNMMIHSNQLYVYDVELRRIQIFSLERLALSHTVFPDPDYPADTDEEVMQASMPIFIHSVRKDGSFLVLFDDVPPVFRNGDEAGYTRYYILDSEGKSLSGKIMKQKQAQTIASDVGFQTSFNRKPLLATSEDGYIYTAWSGEFLVRVHDHDGEYLRAFYHPFEKVPLNHDMIRSEYGDRYSSEYFRQAFQQAIRNAGIPETWPALESMMVDDENRIWISTIVADDSIYEWRVHEDTGELIARIEWPRDKPILRVKKGRIYTRETQEETGLQQIVRYRMRKIPFNRQFDQMDCGTPAC